MRWSSLFFTLLCAWSLEALAVDPNPYDYVRMWKYTRELLTRKPVQKFLNEVFKEELTIDAALAAQLGLTDRIRELTESQFMEILKTAPQVWSTIDDYLKNVPELAENDPKYETLRKEFREKFKSVLDAEVRGPKKGKKITLLEKIKLMSDPTVPFALEAENGQPAYRKMQMFSSHPGLTADGKIIAADNLKQIVIDFIDQAEKEIVINIYDFDLEEVMEALIRAKKRGVSIRVGFDAQLINKEADVFRPEVKKIFDTLKKAGIKVFKVDAVGLNHQKLFARDWSLKGKGKALLSSANLTASCMEPLGDNAKLPIPKRPEYAIPNANHIISFESDEAAQLLDHQLTKLLDMGLRGAEMPLGGMYELPGIATKAGQDGGYALMSFSPRGGMGDSVRDIVARSIREGGCDIKMVVFALSSADIYDALIQKAKDCKKLKKKFNFQAVGDGPFSTAEWSLLLQMSCLQYVEQKPKPPLYKKMKDCDWEKILGKKDFEEMVANIRVGPAEYGSHFYKMPDGTKVEFTAKVHIKGIVQWDPETQTGYVIDGTSGNFSKASGIPNTEQFLVIHNEPEMAERFMNYERFLHQNGKSTVAERAAMKNQAIERSIRMGGNGLTLEDNLTNRLAREIGITGINTCDDALKTLPKLPRMLGKAL